jgi:hypothetical protein
VSEIDSHVIAMVTTWMTMDDFDRPSLADLWREASVDDTGGMRHAIVMVEYIADALSRLSSLDPEHKTPAEWLQMIAQLRLAGEG